MKGTSKNPVAQDSHQVIFHLFSGGVSICFIVPIKNDIFRCFLKFSQFQHHLFVEFIHIH